MFKIQLDKSHVKYFQSVDQDTQSQVDLLEHDKLAAEHKSHELENQLATVQAEKTEVVSK